MHDRKVEMAKRVGAFIGLPGGFGSFDEVLQHSFLFWTVILTESPNQIIEVITWNQVNIHNKRKIYLPLHRITPSQICDVVSFVNFFLWETAVVLLNVLSYYNPLRELIRNGVREGFIQPQCEQLVVFVDGPADLLEHERFDWGKAALEAIDSWKYDEIQTKPFHWNKDQDSGDMTVGGMDMD